MYGYVIISNMLSLQIEASQKYILVDLYEILLFSFAAPCENTHF